MGSPGCGAAGPAGAPDALAGRGAGRAPNRRRRRRPGPAPRPGESSWCSCLTHAFARPPSGPRFRDGVSGTGPACGQDRGGRGSGISARCATTGASNGRGARPGARRARGQVCGSTATAAQPDTMPHWTQSGAQRSGAQSTGPAAIAIDGPATWAMLASPPARGRPSTASIRHSTIARVRTAGPVGSGSRGTRAGPGRARRGVSKPAIARAAPRPKGARGSHPIVTPRRPATTRCDSGVAGAASTVGFTIS